MLPLSSASWVRLARICGIALIELVGAREGVISVAVGRSELDLDLAEFLPIGSDCRPRRDQLEQGHARCDRVAGCGQAA